MFDSATSHTDGKEVAPETADRQEPPVIVEPDGPEAQVLKNIQEKQTGKPRSGSGIRACILV